MVLVAFVLVLLAAATFAAGIAASRTSDTLVYLSIVFSLAAFVVLAIASVRARKEAALDAPGENWPAEPTPTRTIEETEAHAGALVGGLDPSQLDMTPSWRQGRQRKPAPEPEPALADEDDEALEAQLEDEEDEADLEVPVEPVAAAGSADDLWWGNEEEEPTAAFSVRLDEFDDEDDDLDLPEAQLEPEPELEPEPDEDAGSISFFDEYDDLTAAEILSVVRTFDLEDLEWVRGRERSGAQRATVLNEVEKLVAEKGGRPLPRKRAAAKKAAPARRATKKSTRRR